MKKSTNALVYVRRVLGERLSAISSCSKSRWAISLRDKGDAAMVDSNVKLIQGLRITELPIILTEDGKDRSPQLHPKARTQVMRWCEY
jgi:hypothetical protein